MRVAVVGVGAMGSRVALRLLGAGHDVVVWNRSPDRAASLADAGATVARTPCEATSGTAYVITMLADPAALLEVVTAADGLREGLVQGQTVLEMSTVGPSAVRAVGGLLPAGAELLDTPVLGSLSEVDAGTLTVFAGGPPDLVAAARPLLDDLASSVLHVGPLGAGAAAKLVANATLLGTLGVLGEALAIGTALGLDPDRIFDVLATTPLAAQAERRRPILSGEDVPVRFRLALAEKDAALIAGEGTLAGADVRLLAEVEGWFHDAVRAGAGERDYSAVVRHIVDAVQPPDD
ncbi:MAG TPA: NAD(P)-dependent oxidoreductase [Mycobacteriales bacterium]|nr:NAD(P)-dependent oxidoreductase [Mycobacteriales bacterium]